MKKERKARGWLSIFWTVLAAGLVVLIVDFLAGKLSPVYHPQEVEDALVELRQRNPRWLVIGSSHARTFSVVDQHLSRLLKQSDQMLAVPVEYGKMSSYQWVLHNRVLPILEEKTQTGRPVRSNLQGALIVTEWWDTTAVEGGGRAHNLPARVWNMYDFLKDVWNHGLTPYNQNYVRNRWMRIGYHSSLMSDRGHGRILKRLREKLRPLPTSTKKRLYRNQLLSWQRMVEAGSTKMLAPSQMASFHQLLNYFQNRNIPTTVLLYPRMPGTITKKGKKDTLDTFAKAMKRLCKKRKVGLIDLSHQSPLKDIHFSSDFDHLTAEGNQLFAKWSLKGPLRFLWHSSTKTQINRHVGRR